MQASAKWKDIGWRHGVWELVRYYFSLRGDQQRDLWLSELRSSGQMSVGIAEAFPIDRDDVELLSQYLGERRPLVASAYANLRSEEAALSFCRANSIAVGQTRTKNADHHQSSKALVATVSHISATVCHSLHTSLESNPQKRCVWCTDRALHVTARNLDGAIPGLANPVVIWEIKEYWGKTNGGSKMSDAVYECSLVGRELREFQERSGVKVHHVVFVDGLEQWTARRSDLARFIDLTYQGLIDHLFVGAEVECNWSIALRQMLTDAYDLPPVIVPPPSSGYLP